MGGWQCRKLLVLVLVLVLVHDSGRVLIEAIWEHIGSWDIMLFTQRRLEHPAHCWLRHRSACG
jgi:hypothetical protein